MAFDTKKWLVDDMGFTADEADALAPKFGDRADKLEKGYLRQSDYSKQMNALNATKATLDEKDAKLTADMAEWAEMTAAEQAKAGDLRRAIEEGQAKVLTLEQKITRLADEHGVDPATVLGEHKPAPKKEESTFDPTDLRNQLNAQIGGIASYMLDLNAELPAMIEEHRQLTGESFDTRAFIAGIKADIAAGKTKNLDPVKRWEGQFDIPAKRSAKSVEQRAAEISAAEARGRQAAISEQALPNTNPRQGTTAPVFKTSNFSSGSKLQRPQPSHRLDSAVQALATGKYRTKVPA